MHDLPLIKLIAGAFAAAWVLGIVTQRLRLSPIVGYLLAGVAIGPHTPGFVGDVSLAPQLAEIGVILLMFGVGLHFHLRDLLSVARVAVPGAMGQCLVVTLLGSCVAAAFGFPIKSALVLGFALSVASTVVLMRVLGDARLLDGTPGRVAAGWAIVHDVLSVVVLVLIPAVAGGAADAGHGHGAAAIVALALAKLAALVAIMLLAGSRVVSWIVVRVARLRSHELFTLTVLVMAIAVAVAASWAFGASIALAAFLAGMVVGQSPAAQQAAADVLPLRSAFAVLFFVSVGMLFDPLFVARRPGLTAACLAIVLAGNSTAAAVMVSLIGYPARTALTVAVGLAQIGEFSFILSEQARRHGLLGDDGHHVLVACALATITVNPVLFRQLDRIEAGVRRFRGVWRFMNRGADRRQAAMIADAAKALEGVKPPLAVILGYGPVGRAADSILRDRGMPTVVVDLNMDTVQELRRAGRPAIYGDGSNPEILADALARATHLVIALPATANRAPIIGSAKLINPSVRVFVRARYVSESQELKRAGADAACYEEAEAAVALAKLVLADRGADEESASREITRIRQRFSRSAF